MIRIHNQSLQQVQNRDWGLLILLLLVLVPVSNVLFTSDSMGYIRKGAEFAGALEYTDPTRGPGMPAITAIAIWLLGSSATTLMLLTRIGFVIAGLAFAGFAWRLYGRAAGWIATLYFVFAPLVHWPATRFHVDIFLVAGALLSLWCLYEGLQRRHWGLGALSGVLVALTFLTKETAILLFPVWAVAWLLFPPYDRTIFKAAGAAVLGLGVTLSPWIAILHFDVGDVSLILGENVNQSGTFDVFLAEAFSGPVQFVTLLGGRFLAFFSHYFVGSSSESVAAMGVYGVLVIAALGVLLFRCAVRRQQRDLYLLLAMAAYGPFIIYLGWAQYDPRQSAVIFAIAALTVAPLCLEVMRAAERLDWSRLGRAAAPAHVSCAGLVIVGVALAAGTESFHGRFTGRFHAHTFFLPGKEAFAASGALSPNLVDATAWVAERAGPAAAVMTDHRRSSHYVKFALARDVTYSPVRKHNIRSYLNGVPATPPKERSGRSEAIFLQPNRAPDGLRSCIDPNVTARGRRFCKLYYLREDDFIRTVRDAGARFFIVTPRFRYIEAYLEQNPDFVKERDFGTNPASLDRQHQRSKVTVYTIREADPVPGELEIAVNYSLATSLEAFEATHPRIYSRWKDEILFDRFGVSERQLASILARETRCFTKDMYEPAFLPCLGPR